MLLHSFIHYVADLLDKWFAIIFCAKIGDRLIESYIDLYIFLKIDMRWQVGIVEQPIINSILVSGPTCLRLWNCEKQRPTTVPHRHCHEARHPNKRSKGTLSWPSVVYIFRADCRSKFDVISSKLHRNDAC